MDKTSKTQALSRGSLEEKVDLKKKKEENWAFFPQKQWLPVQPKKNKSHFESQTNNDARLNLE